MTVTAAMPYRIRLTGPTSLVAPAIGNDCGGFQFVADSAGSFDFAQDFASENLKIKCSGKDQLCEINRESIYKIQISHQIQRKSIPFRVFGLENFEEIFSHKSRLRIFLN
ncbi:MAG: hypothetical protein JWM08_1003 [Candidatus Angelobacter sp.]|nr:hypothetical protein [Candidatus Angelobacter sp.]